jgi:predicted AAA+ superfamily ATPase
MQVCAVYKPQNMDEALIIPRKSSYDSGAASEFLVLSTLFRLGVNAFITLGNKKSIDIVIKGKNGTAITVDVKGIRDYSSIPINNVKMEKNHFIVVVIYKKKFTDPTILPDFYIIPSVKIEELKSTFGDQTRLMTGRLITYKDNWKLLQK